MKTIPYLRKRYLKKKIVSYVGLVLNSLKKHNKLISEKNTDNCLSYSFYTIELGFTPQEVIAGIDSELMKKMSVNHFKNNMENC